LEGVRVLVVEDTWHVAKALKSALEQVGMDVSGPAATTAEARRLMVEQMPLVAVVDVNLKGEMAGGLIEELHDQGVSVVVVSGYAVPPISADKAAAILQKPFSGSELLHASGQHPGWVGLGQAAWAAAVTVRRCQGSSSVMRLAG
jgi:DNA-binding response OmpR family regulator